jgi:hypothetical protein
MTETTIKVESVVQSVTCNLCHVTMASTAPVAEQQEFARVHKDHVLTIKGIVISPKESAGAQLVYEIVPEGVRECRQTVSRKRPSR